MALELTSESFSDNGVIPVQHTCDGENSSPPLRIAGVPVDSVSLVLIVDDPDSAGGDWLHWLVWNIDPGIEYIEEGGVPSGGIEGYNDFGKAEYGGPCPASGKHRYQFRLYALDIELELDDDAERRHVEKEIGGHILDEVQLTGLYSRE